MFKGYRVGRVTQFWVIDPPAVGSLIWESSIPFEVRGTCHLVTPWAGEQVPWWDDGSGSRRRQPSLPEEVGYREVKSGRSCRIGGATLGWSSGDWSSGG